MPLFKKKNVEVEETVVQDINDNQESDVKVEKTESDNTEIEKPLSLFDKMKKGLSKTRENLMAGVDNIAKQFGVIDEELFEALEEILILADLGVETAMELVETLRDRVKAEKVSDPKKIKELLADAIKEKLKGDNASFNLESPAVILIIGVNGVGKTTTIGKLTKRLKSEGKSVLIAAADTFRAAAVEQLEIWCQRSDVPLIKHESNSDPAAVVYDGVQAAKARNVDVLIVDTAGRLHNKKNLMEELNKIFRIISTHYGEVRREVFLVLDATTGQNAVQQAKLFKETADITGIVLTKLDGTAKGGVIVSIKNELDIPVRYVGVGEGIDDLQPFDPEIFAKALIGN
ncbi:MAG: signal recognition particle-docking protein FtsY [Defluviitaleaceae bacterium]|nr:signal recognition particle-docking protein FtsY [Defluviitaleaceae bacterium]